MRHDHAPTSWRLCLPLLLAACTPAGRHPEGGHDGGGSEEGPDATRTRLHSTALRSRSPFARSGEDEPVASTSDKAFKLENITGLAQSVIFFIDGQDSCGKVVWSSDPDAEPGTETVFEDFDLLDPAPWSHTVNGWAPHCEEGTMSRFGFFAAFWDLHLDVGGTPKTIRVAFGDHGAYKKGDLLIQQGESFAWLSMGEMALYPESGDRPADARQVEALAELPYHQDSEGNAMRTLNFGVDIADREGIASPIPFKKRGIISLDIDINLQSPALSIADASSDEALLATIEPDLLDVGGDPLTAVVSIEYGGSPEDPSLAPESFSSEDETWEGGDADDITVQILFAGTVTSWLIDSPHEIDSLAAWKELFAATFHLLPPTGEDGSPSLVLASSGAGSPISVSTLHFWVHGSEVSDEAAFEAMDFDPRQDPVELTLDGI